MSIKEFPHWLKRVRGFGGRAFRLNCGQSKECRPIPSARPQAEGKATIRRTVSRATHGNRSPTLANAKSYVGLSRKPMGRPRLNGFSAMATTASKPAPTSGICVGLGAGFGKRTRTPKATLLQHSFIPGLLSGAVACDAVQNRHTRHLLRRPARGIQVSTFRSLRLTPLRVARMVVPLP